MPGLVGAITDVDVLAPAVTFLGLHSAIDQPKGVDVTGDVPENGESDVDQEVAAAAGEEGRCGWREDDRDQDEADV